MSRQWSATSSSTFRCCRRTGDGCSRSLAARSGTYRRHSGALFLSNVAATLGDGDTFLLGVDLVKSPARLVAAYDDASGVSREFNLNVLRVLNRELDGDFDVSAFEHVARWNAEAEWMEMFVRSLREQTVRLEALELEVGFDAGELMRTEISAKFHQRRLTSELEAAGLAVQRWWTDDAGDFAVLLASATRGG